MTSQVGVGEADVEAGGRGLSWQITKHGQCFKTGSSRELAQKSMKASSRLTLATSVVFEVRTGMVGRGAMGIRGHVQLPTDPTWKGHTSCG
jgi:hypothetical protein